MQVDDFNQRVAAIRRRFASSLEGRIKDTYAVLPALSGEGSGVVEAVCASYGRIHEICGVGPVLGFAETGRVAREVEAVLLGAFRARRGLTAEEVEQLKPRLDALAAAAQIELQNGGGA